MAKIDLIKNFLKDGIDEKEVESALDSLSNIDESFLESAYKSGDKSVRSFTDRLVTKSLETFKTQTMSPLIEQQVNERLNNEKNKTESQRQFEKLEALIIKQQQDAERKDHINAALTYASGKIPPKYVDKLLGANIDETKSNIEDFIKDLNIKIDEEVDERLQPRIINGKIVNKDHEKSTFTPQEIAKMSKQELKDNWAKIQKQYK